MNLMDKKKEDLIIELKDLKGKYESLRRSYAADVLNAKRVDGMLMKSEEKFRKAFITSPDSININRLSDGIYISINEGFTKITGYTEEDVAGKTSLELKIWSDPGDRDRLVKGLKKNGKVDNLEAIFNGKDGRIIYGMMSATIIDLDNVPHILSVTRDITDRHNTEEALKSSEEKFRAIAENLTDVIFLTDKEGKIRYISPALRSFGYNPEDCLGEFFGTFLSEGELEKAMKVFSNALNNVNIRKNVTLVFKRKDGSSFFGELSGSPYTF